MEQTDALWREHRQLRTVLERYVREREAPPTHTDIRVVHLDGTLSEHSVLHLVGGQIAARRRGYHPAYSGQNETSRARRPPT
ncbi:unnamed protein product [Callosobruchus maculatus]|uniref:Uncharacterized protein n=1 Tax=Callosobruchus maculatus TaxID=64391 RepID=A0A653DQ03_CALMS|nr:unnamed protein product [Callosobruchus maculatus]